ncbi:TonB-dependent receptor plug domain-containing protein [Sphingomonas jatrophae]|uniref:Vitamin B12 transporter n=1 Tax=Sphingomonas jatrophae TaxID=1166337 RepID=A0A1I6JBS1_9SPHN|nr:TonB-dependent receptor [Sphingomonas jatrophae]SFR76386.1 vitamin B12 transporter [Sphingomonas jatrophae]
MKFASISLLALAAAAPAFAQSTPGSLDAPDDRDVVVTASRSGDAVPANMIGSSVTVLDAKALESRQTRVLSDVLRDVPGVAVNRTGGVGGQTQVRIRGSEANHVLVFIDGIKASDPFYGEYDFGNLLADESARVEVLRGQQSALYGSDAIGGVITYTTLSGREAPGYTARVEGGSFGTVAGALRAAGTLGETADYALSATGLTTDGFATAEGGERETGSDNAAASAKLNWDAAPNLRVTAVARYSYTKADTNDQDIAATSPVVLGYPVIATVDTPGSYYKNSAFYGLLSAQLSLLDGRWTNALSAQITDANRDGYNAFGYSYGDRGRRYRGNFVSAFRIDGGRAKHRLTLAVDGEREEFRTVDPFGFAFTGESHIDTVGFVGQYDLTVDDALALGASVRHDVNSRFNDATTWRATASYLLDSGTRLRGAYGTGVKAPTSTELFGYSDGQYIGNPDLRPEKSRGWEAGVEQSLMDRRLVLGATYFRNRFFDQIETAYVSVGGQFLTTSRNNDAVTKQRGVETYANLRAGDFRVDASYTYLKAPQTLLALAGPAPAGGGFQSPVVVGGQAVRRPKHIASLNLSYAPEAQPFSATLTIRYNGRQRDYAFNSSFQRLIVGLDDYALVNLAATYDLTERLELFGRVENLFDADYQEVFTFRTPGRAAYGGIRARF